MELLANSLDFLEDSVQEDTYSSDILYLMKCLMMSNKKYSTRVQEDVGVYVEAWRLPIRSVRILVARPGYFIMDTVGDSYMTRRIKADLWVEEHGDSVRVLLEKALLQLS